MFYPLVAGLAGVGDLLVEIVAGVQALEAGDDDALQRGMVLPHFDDGVDRPVMPSCQKTGVLPTPARMDFKYCSSWTPVVMIWAMAGSHVDLGQGDDASIDDVHFVASGQYNSKVFSDCERDDPQSNLDFSSSNDWRRPFLQQRVPPQRPDKKDVHVNDFQGDFQTSQNYAWSAAGTSTSSFSIE